MKLIKMDEYETTSQGAEGVRGEVKGDCDGKGDQFVRVSKEADSGGAEKFVIKGSSITLEGSGDRSGRDVNNSMGLAEAYQWIVLP